MNAEISSFAGEGDIEQERLIIRANKDLEIGAYVLFVSRLSDDGKAVAGRKTAYWFPDDQIKAGDLVVLYTKAGHRSAKDIGDGRTAHFYYWGLDKPTWADPKNTAVILRVSEWTHRPAQQPQNTA